MRNRTEISGVGKGSYVWGKSKKGGFKFGRQKFYPPEKGGRIEKKKGKKQSNGIKTFKQKI